MDGRKRGSVHGWMDGSMGVGVVVVVGGGKDHGRMDGWVGACMSLIVGLG